MMSVYFILISVIQTYAIITDSVIIRVPFVQQKNEGHFLATYFVSKGRVTEKKKSSRQTLTNLGYI